MLLVSCSACGFIKIYVSSYANSCTWSQLYIVRWDYLALPDDYRNYSSLYPQCIPRHKFRLIVGNNPLRLGGGGWYQRPDSNRHTIAGGRFWISCVYQFHHSGTSWTWHQNPGFAFHSRSTGVPQKGQFETMRDKIIDGHKQKNHLRISIINGLSWSFDVSQNGAQERTWTSTFVVLGNLPHNHYLKLEKTNKINKKTILNLA